MSDHPLAERLGSYRERAAAARRHADHATSAEAKKVYENLATSWEQLISEIVAVIEADKH